MNYLGIAFASILILLTLRFSPSQTQHIHRLKEGKETLVETNFLYLRDDQDEFVEVQFRSWFKGETPQKPPRSIDIWFYAISNRGRYRGNDEHKLIAVTDGEEWKLGNLNDFGVFRGETNNGKEAFFAKEGLPVGIAIPVPQTAQVRDKGKINGLTAEAMFLELKLEQLSKLAKAKTIVLRLGKSSSFMLGEGHLEAVREFASAITPP